MVPSHLCVEEHTGVWLGQSAGLTHCTQLPIPSHLMPLGVLHATPAATLTMSGVPLVQTPVAHGFVDFGRSVSSAVEIVPPFPSHRTFWQSPAVCIGTTVPIGV